MTGDPQPTACPRLDRLPRSDLRGGLRVFHARTPRARLLGLAWLDEPPPGCALLLPRCRSVHTFGMRFDLDVVFLDRAGAVLRVERGLPRRRQASARGARSVLETRAGEADRFLEAGAAGVAVGRAGRG